jgi:hypothetical protein
VSTPPRQPVEVEEDADEPPLVVLDRALKD